MINKITLLEDYKSDKGFGCGNWTTTIQYKFLSQQIRKRCYKTLDSSIMYRSVQTFTLIISIYRRDKFIIVDCLIPLLPVLHKIILLHHFMFWEQLKLNSQKPKWKTFIMNYEWLVH